MSEGPCASWESCFFSKPALLSFRLSPKVCPSKDRLVFPEKVLLFLENRPQLLTNRKLGAQALERMEERVSAPVVFDGGRGRGQHNSCFMGEKTGASERKSDSQRAAGQAGAASQKFS